MKDRKRKRKRKRGNKSGGHLPEWGVGGGGGNGVGLMCGGVITGVHLLCRVLVVCV
jgi:hypothetical protein